jgi:enamine deaminase RidA (YjgF/YER057c/UK114 family)
MRKQVVSPPRSAPPAGVWSPVIVLDGGARLVFVSGITSRNPDGTVHAPGDISAQTRRVCESLQTALEASGAALADVVSVTVHVTDITEFDAIHAVRREFFPVEPPTSTMVQVSRLVDARSMIEITAVAAVTATEQTA